MKKKTRPYLIAQAEKLKLELQLKCDVVQNSCKYTKYILECEIYTWQSLISQHLKFKRNSSHFF
jgi:hypothetical protein